MYRGQFVAGLLCFALLGVMGCQSTPTHGIVDAKVVRYADDGRDAFAEGDLGVAAAKYRQAVHRAWAIDDPREAGTNAYNLAAVLVSQSKNVEAIDWLIEARAELCRAGKSAGNTYLLQAKIAQGEGRIGDAAMLIELASCAAPPCDEARCNQCDSSACRQSCLARIPCVGANIETREAVRQCEDDYVAQVELARSRLAAEQYDIACAIRHFGVACELAEGVCSNALQADLQNAAALIHLAKGEYAHAAEHLDREAHFLRCAGNYREIPDILESAAAAYEQAGRVDLAATRLLRVARIHFARGDATTAWSDLQRTLMLWEMTGEQALQRRLSVLAAEIALVQPQKSGTTDVDPLSMDFNEFVE